MKRLFLLLTIVFISGMVLTDCDPVPIPTEIPKPTQTVEEWSVEIEEDPQQLGFDLQFFEEESEEEDKIFLRAQHDPESDLQAMAFALGEPRFFGGMEFYYSLALVHWTEWTGGEEEILGQGTVAGIGFGIPLTFEEATGSNELGESANFLLASMKPPSMGKASPSHVKDFIQSDGANLHVKVGGDLRGISDLTGFPYRIGYEFTLNGTTYELAGTIYETSDEGERAIGRITINNTKVTIQPEEDIVLPQSIEIQDLKLEHKNTGEWKASGRVTLPFRNVCEGVPGKLEWDLDNANIAFSVEETNVEQCRSDLGVLGYLLPKVQIKNLKYNLTTGKLIDGQVTLNWSKDAYRFSISLGTEESTAIFEYQNATTSSWAKLEAVMDANQGKVKKITGGADFGGLTLDIKGDSLYDPDKRILTTSIGLQSADGSLSGKLTLQRTGKSESIVSAELTAQENGKWMVSGRLFKALGSHSFKAELGGSVNLNQRSRLWLGLTLGEQEYQVLKAYYEGAISRNGDVQVSVDYNLETKKTALWLLLHTRF